MQLSLQPEYYILLKEQWDVLQKTELCLSSLPTNSELDQDVGAHANYYYFLQPNTERSVSLSSSIFQLISLFDLSE